jgi:hypothetical protein
MTFEFLTAVKTSVLVFRVITPCGLVCGYQRFGGTCCINFQATLALESTSPSPLGVPTRRPTSTSAHYFPMCNEDEPRESRTHCACVCLTPLIYDAVSYRTAIRSLVPRRFERTATWCSWATCSYCSLYYLSFFCMCIHVCLIECLPLYSSKTLNIFYFYFFV